MWGVLGRGARVLAVAVVLGGLAAACQPVDSGVPAAGEETVVEGTAPPEAAEQGSELAGDLTDLLSSLESVAAEWQEDAAVAEILAAVEGEVWRRATVTFLAPDADRMLVLQVDQAGTSQQRPTLETLELEPVSADGLADMPPLPDGALPPGALVERAGEALEECGIGDVDSVLYSTGAPAAWDGTSWTEPPAWTATLAGGEGDSGAADGDQGGAVAVDPVTGEARPGGCFAG